jgi:DeoR family glycerol-3-phosphate regulon repressor
MPLSNVRHGVLMEQIAAHGRIKVAECAARLHVSRETIRRDLRQLELQGLLRCIYGGAVLQRSNASADRPLTERVRLNPNEKAQVARLAMGRIGDARSIFLDASTTVLALARHLLGRMGLTVTTNSLEIAVLLAGGVGQVIVTGGTVRPIDNALVGHAAIASVRDQVFDLSLMGAASVDLQHGFMDFGCEESTLRQTLLEHSRRCILLVDSSKFGRAARLRTFALDTVKLLVTDRAPPPPFAARFAALGVEVVHG